MRIRTYLTVSYLVLILVVVLGMSVFSELTITNVANRNLEAADDAVLGVTEVNYQLSERILTEYGEKIVEMRAEQLAKEISYILGGRKSYDYEKLRQDDNLRKLATQNIRASGAVAGYLTLGDQKGQAVLHPNKSVEGRNFSEWSDRFPGLWELVERSFTEPNVKGYYSFVDRDNKKRKKLWSLCRSPGPRSL